ncbi:MAG: hypothetical protein EA422_15720 [Gemmatimonadales bacterium]|nr:MAG: hypothetical protein EA422_15720 [Gemmatimonadales bacterium]
MICDNCGAAEAVIHLTQIVDNEMKTLHLCQACGADKGVQGSSAPPSLPLTDFLAQMGKPPSASTAVATRNRCSFCGLSFKQFRESGRLGCSHCWTTFDSHLSGLVRRIHGSNQHVGKVYLSPDPSVTEREKKLEAMRRRLQRAVELEDFERAAELRDEIRTLETERP